MPNLNVPHGFREPAAFEASLRRIGREIADEREHNLAAMSIASLIYRAGRLVAIADYQRDIQDANEAGSFRHVQASDGIDKANREAAAIKRELASRFERWSGGASLATLADIIA